MALPSSFLSEEQFSCSICLDVFTNPVSTPCGHSFCLGCITSYWDGRAKSCTCPLCKESFRKRPDLHVNHTLKEITEQFKRMAVSMEGESGDSQRGGGTEGQHQQRSAPPVAHRPGELPGGLLNEMRSRFQKSASITSLSTPPAYPDPSPPAATVTTGMRRFTVSGASGDTLMDGPPCPQHGQSLALFCRTDQICVCATCMEGEHSGHQAVPAKREWLVKKSQLEITVTELQGMISERERKVEETKASMAEIRASAERESEATVRLFNLLVSALERSQVELLEVVELGRRAAEFQAQALIHDLELEITELQRRVTALGQLAQSNDHILFFKSYPSFSTPPLTKNWVDVTLTPDPTAGAVLRNVTQMIERFQDELKRLPEICLRSPADESLLRYQPKVKRVQEYAADVTLDAGTAHPRLLISVDGKQVQCGERYQPVADTPQRFDRVVCVLSQQGFSSGRHYWEVLVGDKTDWDLGVARRSINRKGKITVSPANGYWFLSLRDRQEYAFRTEPSTPLTVNPRPHRVGIYMDYDKGLLSFYNVDARLLIFTCTDVFSDTIHPFFSPCTNKSGKNEAPLVICPVSLEE